jgi:hypothetical protein
MGEMPTQIISVSAHMFKDVRDAYPDNLCLRPPTCSEMGEMPTQIIFVYAHMFEDGRDTYSDNLCIHPHVQGWVRCLLRSSLFPPTCSKMGEMPTQIISIDRAILNI